jgi:osmoprotectant transport system permease protein
VSNVSIVSVAALLGIPQLGSLFTDGFARNFLDPIAVGILACMVLALVMDLAILLLSRAATPWRRTRVAA